MPGFYSDLPFALLFAPLGFVTGIIFSGILVVGAALRGGASLWGEFLVFGPPLAIASALCAAGSLAVARRAERQEFPGPGVGLTEAELAEHERRELLGRGD